jgi:hypothetical protein
MKPGNLVYVINNEMWGLVPMTVIAINALSGTITCQHPELGTGGFYFTDLAYAKSITWKRHSNLKKIIKLENELSKLKSKLFTKREL